MNTTLTDENITAQSTQSVIGKIVGLGGKSALADYEKYLSPFALTTRQIKKAAYSSESLVLNCHK